MASQRILFVTGRLAESSLRRVLEECSQRVGFEYDIAVLGISVAALMHADWVQRKLELPSDFDRIILPGWCQGSVERLGECYGTKFELGPKDLRNLPEFFGQDGKEMPSLDRYDIEIVAEINHASRLSDDQVVELAERYSESGADVIDLGCIPGATWDRVGPVTRLVCDRGYRVSIDSFERVEVEAAVENGAELVLSCDSSNVDWASQLDVELVVIPDDPRDLTSLESTIDVLVRRGARFRIDPILEPIGFGFADSLARYFQARKDWPDFDIMMGVGNLTELGEVDSAGVNFLLAGVCQELGIRSILTTEVINWARTAVREFDVARRLMYHSVNKNVLPKHLDSRLVMLRDPTNHQMGEEELKQLASHLKDPNFRVFVARGEIHVMNRDGYWRGTDPYQIFDTIAANTNEMDSTHSFYLGYELSKAVTALTLGKQYTQDEALTWGFLTVPEQSAHRRRKNLN